MRDVYLSDPFERTASMAIGNGVLITRNGSEHAVRYLEASDLELLSRKLDEQKQHFLSQVTSQVDTYVEEEAELSRLLPKECLSALRRYVSLSLSHLECHLRDLSVGDVRTEILLAWLESDSSSPPSSDEQHPADSYSAGCTGSVSGHACDQSGCVVHDGPAEQAEPLLSDLKRSDFEDGPEGDRWYQIERACDRLMQFLPLDTLETVNSGGFPAGLAATINSAALAELERRDALKSRSEARNA